MKSPLMTGRHLAHSSAQLPVHNRRRPMSWMATVCMRRRWQRRYGSRCATQATEDLFQGAPLLPSPLQPVAGQRLVAVVMETRTEVGQKLVAVVAEAVGAAARRCVTVVAEAEAKAAGRLVAAAVWRRVAVVAETVAEAA